MIILNPISYIDSVKKFQFDELSDIPDPVLSILHTPGMQSKGSMRLSNIFSKYRLREELLTRETLQRFGAGDYFLIGNPEKVAILTVGINENPDNLENVLIYLKSQGTNIVYLDDFTDDPDNECFHEEVVMSIGAEIVDFESLKLRVQKK